MGATFSILTKLTQFIGHRERVSADNIFVIEIYSSRGGVIRTRPNWALVVPLILVGVAIIVLVAIFLYRKWRAKHCHPIYFAGKVRYARHGDSIQAACEMIGGLECWIDLRKRDLSTHGRIVELYVDAGLTIPLDKKAKVTAPIRIYPKIQK
jgi:hypothetical protein